MRRVLFVLVASLPIALAAQTARSRQAAPARPSFGEPGISPDGSTIAFVSGGDIWEVPSSGGDARLLVSDPATESRPMYSPDGARIAFTSNRTGNGDIYVLTLASGTLTRLTYDDASEVVNGWSRDGRWVYFSSNSHDLSSMNDVFRIGSDGGTAMAVAADRYATEYFAAPGPDGTVAITARAFAGLQWWRKGHSHLDESEIWLVREPGGSQETDGDADRAGAPARGSTPKYVAVTHGGAKDAWPMWSADGKTLYFMSDRSGAQNLWAQSVAGGEARAITSFKDDRVLWPTITADGRTIAFERGLGVWTADPSSGRAREVSIALRGAPSGPAVEHHTYADHIDELALSPDGKKIAFVVHGELFTAPAKDGGDAIRLTSTPANESEIAWAPDSRRLVYVSDRDGTNHLFLYDVASGAEARLTSGAGRDDEPRFSPDGKWIAFERGSRELRTIDPTTKDERLLATGAFDSPPMVDQRDFEWSPDSKYVAYLAAEPRLFENVYVAAAGGGTGPGRPVSFLANSAGGSLSWTPDGTGIVFTTGQRTEPGDVVRVDLVPRPPKFREDQFRDLFKEETPTPAPAAPPPADTRPAAPAPSTPKPSVSIVYDGIRTRVHALPIGLDTRGSVVSPDGKWVLVTASSAGQENLYVYSIDELAKEPAVARQLTSTRGAKGSVQFTPDSKEVMYLDRGRVFTIALDKREPHAVAVAADMDVDFAEEKREVFHQAWTFLRDGFFDEKMNGVDWSAERDRYEPYIAGARTPDEVRRVILLMIGDLNASHSGVSAPPSPSATTVGRLAADFDRAEYEKAGRLRFAGLVPLGPAALGGIRVGEYLRAVNGRPVGSRVNLDELLDHAIDRRTVLAVAASAVAAPRDVIVKPVNQATEKGLRYRQWVEERRAYVAKASGGRLGYVHMYDMSSNSLEQLYLDLDVENQSRDGVVIDVRNNNGGFVNVYAIDVLSRRGYFGMGPRGLPFPPVSSRSLLGQRALERPTILVTNQHSLSDSEDFTEGYRTLKLGKVVGEPTAGWIIYTGGVRLIDGSALRMPRVKIFAHDGTPMEMHPRPVDVEAKRPMGESYTGRDVQLDTAVAELLKEIK